MSTPLCTLQKQNLRHVIRVELHHGLHLAYCTNIHRGETWGETFAALKTHTIAVHERVGPGRPFAIGLRLSATAARELGDPVGRREFRRWLEKNNCYVFTLNGFPYGPFHGARVKEAVYTPDWTTPERLAYTCQLFDLLSELSPPGMAGSVSTLPGSFKAFIHRPEQRQVIRDQLWRCVEHIARLSQTSGRPLQLGLEPEPLCLWENTRETVEFFTQMRQDRPPDDRLDQFLGVNYDTCHLAVEYEEPRAALGRLREAGVKISKIHLSSALKTRPTPAARASLRGIRRVASPIFATSPRRWRTPPRRRNGAFIFTSRCTRPRCRRLKTRTIICSARWMCSRRIPRSASIWKWKRTRGRCCPGS